MFTTACNCTLLQNGPVVGSPVVDIPVMGSPAVGILVLDMQPVEDLEYWLVEMGFGED